ncbi:MAG TPA: hypothetical protein VL326_13310 [Kofleriaceae bacterium]|nr:hypothetical protein [Kofleriaceae bacterium]
MRRRDFIWVCGGGLLACSFGCSHSDAAPGVDAPPPSPDGPDGNDPEEPVGDAGVDACVQKTVKMHDTYAQALYYDGTNGPLTGVVTTAQVIVGVVLTMDFWHGHNGVNHRFTLGPQDFADLKVGKRITVGTTTVDGHSHTLFIDPKDEGYRVPGAPDVDVPAGC